MRSFTGECENANLKLSDAVLFTQVENGFAARIRIEVKLHGPSFVDRD